MSDLSVALTERIVNWQKNLAAKTVTIFSNPADIEYFSDFGFLLPSEREAFLVISATQATLWYASFSPLPVDITVLTQPMYGLQTIVNSFKAEVASANITEIIFDAANLTVIEYELLAKIPNLKLTILDRNKIWQLRCSKDQIEQSALKKANQITAKVLTKVISELKAGQTEIEVAWILEKALRVAGSNALAFPTIVAFGEHTALPHHQPTHKLLNQEMAVLIDVGGKFANYCADMTRSFWFGSAPPAEYKKIHQIVLQAHDTAVDWLKNQLAAHELILAKSLDDKTRQIIITAGYGEQFIHTTGHGVGLDIHEPPSLSWRNETLLPVDVCITIEPGIYLVGKYGYRHENTFQIQTQNLVNLTDVS